MTIDRFVEYSDEFRIGITADSAEEGSRLVRLLLQGKSNTIEIYGDFSEDRKPTLTICVPKAKGRLYHSRVKIGAKKIL